MYSTFLEHSCNLELPSLQSGPFGKMEWTHLRIYTLHRLHQLWESRPTCTVSNRKGVQARKFYHCMQDIIFFKSYNFTLPTLYIFCLLLKAGSLLPYSVNWTTGLPNAVPGKMRAGLLSLSSILRYTDPHAAVTLHLSYPGTLKKFGDLINSNQQVKESDISPLNRIKGCEMRDEEHKE